MQVSTRNKDGSPCCPICGQEVEQAGEFDTPECYQHFITVVADQGMVYVEDDLLDFESQPWHTEGTTPDEGV